MSEYQTSYGSPDVQLYQEPERTSVMAIMSMVFGILGCCLIGLTSILAIPLSIFSMIGISRSKGRVGGMGFAIVGLVMGLLSAALWIGILFGFGGMAKAMVTQFGATTEAILTDVQNGDFDAARQNLSAPANTTTDEQFVEFAAAYTKDLGRYVSMPDGLGDLWSGYMAVGPLIQPYQGQPGVIPMPALFDTGWVLVVYVMNPSGQGPTGSNGMPIPEEIILVGPDGTEYALPPSAGVTQSSSADADASSDVDSETSGDDSAEESTETEPGEPDEGP